MTPDGSPIKARTGISPRELRHRGGPRRQMGLPGGRDGHGMATSMFVPGSVLGFCRIRIRNLCGLTTAGHSKFTSSLLLFADF